MKTLRNVFVFISSLVAYVSVLAQTTKPNPTKTPVTPNPNLTITYSPTVDQVGEPRVKIQKIVITNNYTIVYFIHVNSNSYNVECSSWIQLMPQIQIIAVGGKRRFKFLKAEGIPLAPAKYCYSEYNQKKYFKAYFEKLEPGIEKLDIFECTNTDQYICFNFYGVHIRNPELPKPPPIVENKPMPGKTIPVKTNPSVTVTGKVFDANTKKPISSKIIYEILPSEKQVVTFLTTPTGVYKVSLPPKAIYSYSTSAKGYLVSEEPLDLSKAIDKQIITKNIYLKPIQKGESVVMKNIFFPQGEFTLLDASYNEINKLVRLMKENPTMEIMLEGHTDVIGNPDDNMKLSENRAKAVKEYMIKKGIVGNRIQITAYGGTKPIKTDGTDTDREANRRVEFKILKN